MIAWVLGEIALGNGLAAICTALFRMGIIFLRRLYVWNGHFLMREQARNAVSGGNSHYGRQYRNGQQVIPSLFRKIQLLASPLDFLAQIRRSSVELMALFQCSEL